MPSLSFQDLTSMLHWGAGGFLTLAIVCFLVLFLFPGVRAGMQLRRAHKQLQKMKKSGPVLDLDAVGARVMLGGLLPHCWTEFRDTLHGQRQANAQGALEVTRWRATAMANNFFTEQALVDAPLRTEFFKHLPGILTGLGIIGTFGGLILGLQGFQVTDDAQVVRQSLSTLIRSVGGAFVISGLAITAAMLVTAIEKFVVNRRYTQVETLCGLIDSLFDSGAGEEYLQRLVEASETSATQAMQMKESLVTDLKQVLSELTQQQIAAVTHSNAQLSQAITTSISEGLKEPLARISDAVQAVGTNQGEAVNTLLTDVLSSFSEQLRGMFGGQMQDMRDILQQTTQAVQATTQRFEQLAAKVEQAGTGAADAMAERMGEMLSTLKARQGAANDQMAAFIDQMRVAAQDGQTKSAELMEKTFLDLAGTSARLVKQLQAQSTQASDDFSQRHQQLAQATTTALGQQSDQIGQLTAAVQAASEGMRTSIEHLQAATGSAVDRMARSAERLQGAASLLSDNLQEMASASSGMAATGQQLTGAAGMLDSAAKATERALADHRAVRDTLATMVGELRAVVENAKREAGMTSQLVQGLERASTKLSEAQQASDTYLNGVTQILEETHRTFADQMTSTLRAGNSAFHTELAQATGLLKGAIQDLGDVLDNIPSPVQ